MAREYTREHGRPIPDSLAHRRSLPNRISSTAEQIAAAIAALAAQRALLGDAVVDTALAPLRRELAALRSPPPRRTAA